MERLFRKIRFNDDDDNLDAELRKRVFHCLRRYTESLKKAANGADFNFLRKAFLFVVRFYIALIEEDTKTNSEEFFEASCKFYHQESIFIAKVHNSPFEKLY